ncbi:hypothetical protein EV126DRAFT_178783 [Verticillium dahliae]|uniref:Phytanoyl-CoA dioxygenase n=1 Tax=Verticillium dahliae TaxID=27337 RepID=A0A444RJ05_VERDA|nr:hypothetical protein EV126DRAFT_178783 [Verticillium dahliae]RXG41078.1 hypothetical protein VDGE_30791 [Verticillium dahliae]
MAATPFNLEDALQSIHEKGFYDLNEPLAGDRIAAMERNHFRYFTEYGLDFCNQFAFDARIRSILEESLERCRLGHWLRYKEYPGHVECFRRGGLEAGRRVLMVQLWAAGSQLDYYPRSHLHKMDTFRSRRSLNEILPSELDRVGLKPEPIDLPVGGLIIADARLGFEIKEGYAITFLFATEEVVAKWAKIVLPNSEDLKRKVADMRRPNIDLNFDFEEPNEIAG